MLNMSPFGAHLYGGQNIVFRNPIFLEGIHQANFYPPGTYLNQIKSVGHWTTSLFNFNDFGTWHQTMSFRALEVKASPVGYVNFFS